MSTINRKPIIAKIIEKMKSDEVAFLEAVMDTKEHRNSVAFTNLPDHHDICMAVIQSANYAPLTGVLWNTRDESGNRLVDDYYLIGLFNGEYCNFYHIVDDKFERIKETITLLEIRFWLKGGKGAQITRIQYDDGVLGAPNDAKVRQFVIDSGYTKESEWGNIYVVIKSSQIIWSYIQVQTTPQLFKWVGGGVDTVKPFNNTDQGTIVGIDRDGYVEHLNADSDGTGHVHGWDKKLDKSTSTAGYAQAYIHTSTGEEMFRVDANIVNSSIVRRNGSGAIFTTDISTASNEKEVVNLKSLNIELAKKVDKVTDITDKDQIYSKKADGTQQMLNIDALGKVKDVTVNGISKVDITDGIAKLLVDSTYTLNDVNVPTSSKVAKELNDRIDAISSQGRYLSDWDCTTGKPSTNPGVLPYTYKTGDYYVISVVSTGTNYKPNGTTYDGTASTTVETGTPKANDTYRFDGTEWKLISGADMSLYMLKKDSVGTGTAHLENIIVSGDTTLDDLAVNGDATFTNSPTIPDGVNDTDAVNKKQLDKLSVAYITLTGTSGTLTDAERAKLLSNEPTNNFINKDNMLFKCVYYSAGVKAVYAISGESKVHVITVTLPAGTWNLVTYELMQLLGNEATSGEPYHFPYHFATKFEDGKIKITLYTITLDNNKTLTQYEKELDISDLAKDKVGVGNVEGAKIWAGTKAEYDAIVAKDDATLYYVIDDATEAQGAMNFKGTCLFADLPTSGQKNGDYWVLTDTTGEHVGQAAIWSNTSSEWKLAGATLTVDSSLNIISTNAVQNKVVTAALNTTVKLTGNQTISGIKKFGELWVGDTTTNEYSKLFKDCIKHEKNGTTHEYTYPEKNGVLALTSDISALIQNIYDGLHPVGDIQFGFQAPGVPTGVSATWTDVSNQYNNRYFKVDATYSAGTEQAESLPLPSVSINSAGDHNHDRGDMNITGVLRTAPSADSNVGDTMAIKHASGAFYNAGSAGSGSQRIYDINASYSRDANPQAIGFNAASNWTGNTSTGGSHSHTATVSGSVYSGSAAVKPLTTTIKVFKRTA